jgi:transposase
VAESSARVPTRAQAWCARALSKSIGDAGWGMLGSVLTYMAERSEGVMILVNPRDTSQTCSGCGSLVPKDLSERTHSCLVCWLVLDRDLNASRNILRKGILLEQQKFRPVDETTATPLRLEVHSAPMKQEAA